MMAIGAIIVLLDTIPSNRHIQQRAYIRNE